VILTEEQAKARVESGNNLLNRFRQEKGTPVVEITQIDRTRPGRENYNPLSETEKVELAARARTGESQKELAAEFGVSRQTAMYLAHGGESRVTVDNVKVEARMDEIQDKALCKLLATLGFLDDEKLSKMNGKDLSAVAANMAKVAGNVRPAGNNESAVHLHLYAPELRKEHNYKTIEVSSL